MNACYREFWGKARSRSDPSGQPWHPLAYHCLDVAAVAEALLARGWCRPPKAWDTPEFARSTVALMALHDIGKFSRPFQAKAPDHWPVSLGTVDKRADPGHGVTGLDLLTGALGSSLDALFAGWEESDRLRLLVPVCGHHGRPVEARGVVPGKVACGVCLDAARAFVADILALLQPPPLPAPSHDLDPAITWWLAGLAVMADWIGSAETWFGYTAPGPSLDEYWELARRRAPAAVAASGVLSAVIRPELTLSDLLDRAVSASPVQVLAATLDLGAGGPVLALIEDQTGSGKTEAALLLAHRLMRAGRADGLFVALPTMATANAIYGRLALAYRRLFADTAAPSLVLAHGGRALHDGFQDSILRDIGNAGVADPDVETGSAQCAAWIADDRRRAFLAHVGVGTIDQALLAVLPSRHAVLRLFGLHRHVLLIDEAHAYDPYMHEELLRLLTFQSGLGGSAIVLSATLPTATRKALIDAFAAGQGLTGGHAPRDTSYPLVTVVRDGSVAELPCEGRPGLARRVEAERVGDTSQAVAWIKAASDAGQAVAWVRNSVADASEAHDWLTQAGVTSILFHARFSVGDRARIEQQVMDRYGRTSLRRAGVVVATQVIEQSLDLDFDLMVSDLAPLDLLIQRAGRIWRHDRPERPCPAPPRLLVLCPDPVADPPPDWLGPALRRTGRVYADHALLWRSARVLLAAGGIAAPDDVRRLVQAVYDADDAPAGLSRASGKASGKAQGYKSMAWQNLLRWRDGYQTGAGAWAPEDRTPTRLGEEATRYRLARWDRTTLRPWNDHADPGRAWALSEISLPPWVATGVPPADGALAAAESRVRAKWGRWEQDVPILALMATDGTWLGAVLRAKRRVLVSYDEKAGLSVA